VTLLCGERRVRRGDSIVALDLVVTGARWRSTWRSLALDLESGWAGPVARGATF